MTTTLITGANKSLGFETARRLTEAGHTIYLGSRDEQRGKEAASRIGARPVQIDVTSDESVQAAAALIGEEAGHLDVLVNNAGISGGRKPPGDVTAADMRAVYETNVCGAVRVTHAFLPLLAASSAPVIVMVSSGLGLPALCPGKHCPLVTADREGGAPARRAPKAGSPDSWPARTPRRWDSTG